MKALRVGNKTVRGGSFDAPYFIAEAGVNHEGDMERAKQMIDEVADAGADAIKFQAYKAESLASKDSPAYWNLSAESTKSQYELFKKHDMFWKAEFDELGDYANRRKVDFLATPYDIESADFLEPLVPAYKIASADITNKPLLEHVARKGKPVLLSTGASTVTEIWRAIEWIEEESNTQIALLHCVLNYPTDYRDANLGMIEGMKKTFTDYLIGYSDHTLSDHASDVLITSWLLGARILEKHYTWNKKLIGNDHYHAINQQDLKNFVEKLEFTRRIVGQTRKTYIKSEEIARNFARRSLVAKRDIPKGTIISQDDVTWKRPGTGIPPFMLDEVLGATSLEEIKEDEILTFEKLKLRTRQISF
jgi:sialic acid synthase SpsE